MAEPLAVNGRGESAPASKTQTLAIFLAFLRLGCLSFGGPVAHLGYFRQEFVEYRQWLTDIAFAELVALAQSMPGPASSQVGFPIGLLRGGVGGGCAAWLGFTLPSALLMLGVACSQYQFSGPVERAVLHGLQLVAVGVVAQAVLALRQSVAPDGKRFIISLLGTAVSLRVLGWPGVAICIFLGAAAGVLLLARDPTPVAEKVGHSRVSHRTGILAAGVFAILLLASVFLPRSANAGVALCAAFYRAGALVFGGGHVVLPLLYDSVVPTGWISPAAFLSGYGAAQALPGPLFTFAAFLGAARRFSAHPVLGGVTALVALSLPGLLIMTAVIPFWSILRQQRTMQAALRGVNASVLGVLLAAFYRPVWTGTVHTPADVGFTIAVFACLVVAKAPAWLVVLLAGVASCLWEVCFGGFASG